MSGDDVIFTLLVVLFAVAWAIAVFTMEDEE
jgi:hypothetical protein